MLLLQLDITYRNRNRNRKRGRDEKYKIREASSHFTGFARLFKTPGETAAPEVATPLDSRSHRKWARKKSAR